MFGRFGADENTVPFPTGAVFIVAMLGVSLIALSAGAKPSVGRMRANGKRSKRRSRKALRPNAATARYTVTIPEPAVVREAFAQWKHDTGEEHPPIPEHPTLRQASAYVSEYGFGLLLHRGKQTILVDQSGTSSDGRAFKMRDGYGEIELTRLRPRRR